MYIGIPEAIFLVCLGLNAGVVIVKHGKPRENNYNIFVTLLDNMILLTLLYWGGFFN